MDRWAAGKPAVLMSYTAVSRESRFIMRVVLEIVVAALLTAFAYVVFRRCPAFSSKLGERFDASVKHPALYIVAAMLLPVALRLAMLPWFPPPEPHLHDEFSHLMVADTLTAGRMANPPHSLWLHLETIYILQHPTYSSVYPLGQGLILAVGKIVIGNPWAGVLLSVALMCGATSWMLFGCLPPKWAAAGSLLAAVSYSLANYWVNSYWGGAFCAFGGALLFGALCRLRRSPALTTALLGGLGWAIVWLTRPWESLLLLMIFWGFILVFASRAPRLWKSWLGPVAIMSSMQILAGGVTALQNRAVTGSFTTFPYFLDQQVYGVPQSFLWQKPIEEPSLRFAELKEMYRWQRMTKDHTDTHPVHHLGGNLYRAWHFFVGPWYSLPFVLLIFRLRDWQVIAGCGIISAAMLASVLYPFFFPHYIAAYSCVIFFLILRGLMATQRWSFRGRHVGPVLVLFLVSGGSLMGIRRDPSGLSRDSSQAPFRGQVSNRLMHLPGRHVVFVRYGASHSFQDEWVYNAANVDASAIVWCRAIDPAVDSEVTHYYKDRNFWIADVDGHTVRFSRYQPGSEPSGTTQDLKGASQGLKTGSR
jgi:hypothetical protein